MKTNKQLRREKLMNQPGKIGALWRDNFENLKQLKATAKAQGMTTRIEPPK